MTSTAIPGRGTTLAPGARPGERALRARGLARVVPWCPLAALVAGAGALRLAHLGAVAADPYYDGAVRAMGQSLHAFFFGALEPAATVSLDKPPLDLWPAVLSTKLFGYSAFAIRLPEALAGTAAVALLYAAVRRAFGARAAFAAAAVLAVLPIEVITARSDTTDAIMMMLCTLALYFTVRSLQDGRRRWLVLAAGSLGLAFDVKLAESWLALAPLALMALAGLPARRRVALGAAAATYVAVALAWLVAASVVPASSRPYAVGSTNGSPWDAAFVFNGVERLRGSEQLEGPGTAFNGRRRYPRRTLAQREAIPITPAGPARLLARVGPLSGERLGFAALAALLLGLPATLWAWRRHGRERRRQAPAGPRRGPPVRETPDGTARIRRAVTAGLSLWLIEGLVLFSAMGRLHPRYTEAFLPAVAAMAGIGAAWATARRSRARISVLALAVTLLVLYAAHLLYGASAVWWATLAGGIVALGLAAMPARRDGLYAGAALAALLGCLLAIPLSASLHAVGVNASDGNVLGALPGGELARLSAYLRAHQGDARFEAAYDGATRMGALVVRDGRPVLPLTTVAGAGTVTLVSAGHLYALARAGKVRFAVLSGGCPRGARRRTADCAAPVRWVRANAIDVSAAAGLPAGTLWRLPGAGLRSPGARKGR